MNYAELFFRLTKKRVLYNIMSIKNIPTVIKHGILSYNNIDFQHESIADQGNQVSENTDASKSGSSRQSSIILEMGRLDFSFSLYRLMRFKAIFRKTLSCS